MVHHENLLCFHYRPLFDDKSGSSSQTWPSPLPPIQCCFKGDTLSALTQHCTGGGGGGRGEGTVKLSKKAKCTISFDQDCIYSEIWLQMSITSRGPYVFEPNLDRKFLQAPFMYCQCIYSKQHILECILQHNNEVSRGKFWKMFYNRTKIEQITVKTRFIRHRWCRESTITSEFFVCMFLFLMNTWNRKPTITKECSG